MTSRRTAFAVALVVAVLLALAPFVSSVIHVDVTILSEVLLFALAVMSVNLLLGYTGLPAFGNAAYFGLGAYGAALPIKYFHFTLIEATVSGVILALLGALVLGPFLLRRRGIYFGLLSIAFGQVFYFIAYRFTSITNGEDGLTIQKAYVGIPGSLVKFNDTSFYYMALVVYLAVVFAFWVIERSPFGRTLVAIRQNEARVRYLGLNTDRFIFVALFISAGVAGLGGALSSQLNDYVGPLVLDWHQSGDFVLMMILGGAGTVFGPLIGAFIYVIGKDIISTITPLWQIFLGSIFVICVLGFPKGILGTFLAMRRGVSIDVESDTPEWEANTPQLAANKNG
jgi:branched-chain amino acid transport system permease protein